MARTYRRRVPLFVLALVALLLARPTFLLLRAWLHDRPATDAPSPGLVDDASRLNRTPVAEVWPVPSDPADAEDQLRALLRRARADRLGVAIAGARHSMGGHTIQPDGVIIDTRGLNRLEMDAGRLLLRAGAGARWSEIIPYLDDRGFSVGVMQSNNDFSVGGSVSVNCHGWQPNRPPIASSVESLRLMTADGAIVRCSRAENAELFALALGGYGLFGVILDVDLRVVPNERYRPEFEVLPVGQYRERYAEKVTGVGGAGLAFGRLCVVPGETTFLREAILTIFRQAPGPREEMPALKSAGLTGLRRELFRAQIDSDAGKKLRWDAETKLGERITRRYFSRNQLLNESAEVYREQNADRTDILHEYFIPEARLTEFLDHIRPIIPRHGGDLLNVTVRNVLRDEDTFLRYADQDVFGFVMLFSQERTTAADARMTALTRALIEAAAACGGRYYLPYRLHATPEQMHRAYPRAREFFERKRKHDPDELFRNQFYNTYGRT